MSKKVYFLLLAFIYSLNCICCFKQNSTKHRTTPNIVVILTDDLGWYDIGFHGSNEIPTPNIDALGYSGVILNRYYSTPICTPSRTALLTGRYPTRMGLQGLPINNGEPRGVPLREKLLPEYLKKLGYVTRLVGKWHLGYYTEKHLPSRRGFDSFVGYYGGYIRYFNHTITKAKHLGIDLHRESRNGIYEFNNDKYFTDFITEEAEIIIKNHDKKKPLYLHIVHLAPHASEGIEPLEVRNLTDLNEKLGYIPDLNRRKLAGMVTAVDDSVGKVIKALSDVDMLENSVILFMSDNGAPSPDSSFTNHGSNYPLRGAKVTNFEGGVRVPAIVFSPLLQNRSRVSEEYIHITDWFPTLYKLAGGKLEDIQNLKLDGFDQWSTIRNDGKSKRNSMFLNIDEVFKWEGAIMGKYKLIKGNYSDSVYYAEDGNVYSPAYNVDAVRTSMVGKSIEKIFQGILRNKERIIEMRKQATLYCPDKSNYSDCSNGKLLCLFNIINDPCETTDISEKHPEMVLTLEKFIDSYRAGLTDQTNTYQDLAGYPENFNGYWLPWMDHEYTPPADRNMTDILSIRYYCEGFLVSDPRNCL